MLKVSKAAETQQSQQAEKRKTDALIARIQGDRDDAIASARIWAIIAYVAIGSLICLLIAYAAVVLTGRERSDTASFVQPPQV